MGDREKRKEKREKIISRSGLSDYYVGIISLYTNLAQAFHRFSAAHLFSLLFSLFTCSILSPREV